MNYITKSLQKFKEDLLAKGLYDIVKAISIAVFTILVGIMIPYLSYTTGFIFRKFSLAVYELVIAAFALVIVTLGLAAIYNRRRMKKMLEDTNTDELTGLRNHRALETFLVKKISEMVKKNGIMSLIIIDVDDFKEINTQFQYSIADKVLKKLGELLGNERRGTDETFRKFHRGDEFIVILENTSLSEAKSAAERRRKVISENEIEVNGYRHKITISCGVTECKKDDDMASLIDRATRALFEAKKQPGKNCTKTLT